MAPPFPPASAMEVQQQQQPPPPAHVHLVDAAGVDLGHEDLEHLCHDDATGQLLAVKGGHVFAYAAAGNASPPPSGGAGAGAAAVAGASAAGALRWMYPLQPGPPVVALRPSLDNRTLAVQRGAALIELVDLATGACSAHSAHGGRGRILAFFFSDAPGADLVVATDRAVEVCAFAPRRQGLRLVKRARRRCDWALYTHETRMLVVGRAGGGGGGGGLDDGAPTLSSWQFTASGIVHIPLFELRGPSPAAAAARAFITGNGAEGSSGGGGGGGVAGGDDGGADGGDDDTEGARRDAAMAAAAAPLPPPAAPWVAPEAGPVGASAASGGCCPASGPRRAARVWLLRLYGRVYLAHARAAAAAPSSSAVAAAPAAALDLYRFYSDALLLERTLDLASPDVELSACDGALVVHYPPAAVAAVADVAARGRQPVASPLPLRRLAPRAGGGGAAGAGYESVEAAHGAGWHYLAPNLVLDADTRRLYRLHLDLSAVAETAPDWPSLAGFLQRRRPSPAAGALASAGRPPGDPKALLLGVCRAALQAPLELPSLRQLFAQLARGQAAAAGRAAPGAAPAPGALSPEELAEGLFAWAHGEEVVDALYLGAAIAEYQAAASSLEPSGAPPAPPALAGLAAELLLQQGAARGALALLRAGPPALGLPLAAALADEEKARRSAGGGGAASAPPSLRWRVALDTFGRMAAAEVHAAARAGAGLGSGGNGAGGAGLGIAAAAAAIAGAPAAAHSSPAASAAAVADAAARRALPHAEAHVARLAASGQLLRAARLARDRALAGALDPDEALRAAAARGDSRLFAALCRAFGRGGGEDGKAAGDVEAAMVRASAAAAAAAAAATV